VTSWSGSPRSPSRCSRLQRRSAASPTMAPRTRADQPSTARLIAGAVARVAGADGDRLRNHALWDTQLFGTVRQRGPRPVLGPPCMPSCPTDARARDRRAGRVPDRPDHRGAAAIGSCSTAETLAVDLALVQLAKYLVQRPRPYLYNHSPEAARFASATGDDGWTSFTRATAAMKLRVGRRPAPICSGHVEPQTRERARGGAGHRFAIAAATSKPARARRSSLLLRRGDRRADSERPSATPSRPSTHAAAVRSDRS